MISTLLGLLQSESIKIHVIDTLRELGVKRKDVVTQLVMQLEDPNVRESAKLALYQLAGVKNNGLQSKTQQELSKSFKELIYLS